MNKRRQNKRNGSIEANDWNESNGDIRPVRLETENGDGMREYMRDWIR